MEEETEAQRYEVSCPESHSWPSRLGRLKLGPGLSATSLLLSEPVSHKFTWSNSLSTQGGCKCWWPKRGRTATVLNVWLPVNNSWRLWLRGRVDSAETVIMGVQGVKLGREICVCHPAQELLHPFPCVRRSRPTRIFSICGPHNTYKTPWTK